MAEARHALLLTAAEAIERLDRGRDAFVMLVREGRLPCTRFPDGALAFSPTDVDAAMRPVPAEEAARELESRPLEEAKPKDHVSAPTHHDDDQLISRLLARLDRSEKCARPDPRWLSAKDAKFTFGVDRHHLEQWAAAGLVKRAKFSPRRQSKALYLADDIHRLLVGVASGTMSLPDDRRA